MSMGLLPPTLEERTAPLGPEAERPALGEFASRVGSEAVDIVCESLRLLSAEAQDRVHELGPVLLGLGVAAGALLVSVVAVAGGLALALSPVLPLWAAALLVGPLALAVATGLWRLASRRLRDAFRAPEHTLEALEEGAESLRYRARRPPLP
jgi:uncharacterized membrane protein YqjE